MLFNSFNFLLLFPVLFGLYWLIPVKLNKARQIYLLIASYSLYLLWKPAFALILLYITIITYFGAIWVFSLKNEKKRAVNVLLIVLSVLPLLFFKYFGFINQTVADLFKFAGLSVSLPGLNIAIPVGISFYTFQAVGYYLDVYSNKIQLERDLLAYMLFVSFFPQVASGPISKADELLPQIKKLPDFDSMKSLREGVKYIIWGLFLKMVLADRLGLYVDTICGNYSHYSGIVCAISAVFYSFQIYGDFAGYSLMAIGIAQLLGIRLPDNFRRPYFAFSISDFWRRWHITLSRWLKEHIYIPMGGSRCSKLRNYWNIIVTFFVSGVWHGANWTFIIWGLIHGGVQVVEKATGLSRVRDNGKRWILYLRIIITFIIVTVAWIFFRMPSIGDALLFIKQIFVGTGSGLPDNGFANLAIIAMAFLLLISKDVKDEFFEDKHLHKAPVILKYCYYILLVAIILSCGVLDSGQFIYTSF